MKVALLDPSMNGGIVHYTTSLYNELKHICDVDLIVGKDSTYRYGIKTLYTRGAGTKPTLRTILRLIYHNLGLIFRLDFSKYDIIHFEWDAFLPLTPFFMLLTRKKIIWTAHNVVPHESNAFLKFYSYLIYRLSSSIIVHSEYSKDKLLKLKIPGKKIQIISHGIYINEKNVPREKAKKSLGLNENDKIILFFGVIRKYKGLEYLIKAFKLLKNQSYKLIIAGKPINPDETQIKKMVSNERNIFLRLYYIPDDDRDILFSASDVVVLPYLEIDQSGVIFQSIGSKRAIVSTDIDPIKEIVSKVGFTLPKKNIRLLAESIDSILSDNRLREKFERNCDKLIDEYGWRAIAKSTLELYEKQLLS